MSESLKIDRWFRAFGKLVPCCAGFFKISTGISFALILCGPLHCLATSGRREMGSAKLKPARANTK
jgi:hypothetical protein